MDFLFFICYHIFEGQKGTQLFQGKTLDEIACKDKKDQKLSRLSVQLENEPLKCVSNEKPTVLWYMYVHHPKLHLS